MSKSEISSYVGLFSNFPFSVPPLKLFKLKWVSQTNLILCQNSFCISLLEMKDEIFSFENNLAILYSERTEFFFFFCFRPHFYWYYCEKRAAGPTGCGRTWCFRLMPKCLLLVASMLRCCTDSFFTCLVEEMEMFLWKTSGDIVFVSSSNFTFYLSFSPKTWFQLSPKEFFFHCSRSFECQFPFLEKWT